VSGVTGIEWTDATWNPWMGCEKVSPGCAHCYMYDDQRQYGNDPSTVRRSKTLFSVPLKWSEPKRVFTCSWSDWFIEAADAWRPEAWEIIRRTPHLTYQILTKRPELIPDRLPPDWDNGYPNVWLGTSIENRRFVHRADALREIPAAVRFISAEPLLGPLVARFVPEGELGEWVWPDGRISNGSDVLDLAGIDWLIAGGESGSKARPCNADWLCGLRDLCQASGVAFFLKQLGGPRRNKRDHEKALLDGRRWLEMPA
jgi:protein gp37